MGRPEIDTAIGCSISLPYKKEEIEELKRVSLHWVREMCKYIDIQSYHDMVSQCQTGVLLCKLVSSVLGRVIDPSHNKPST
jgi:hypothetical protein